LRQPGKLYNGDGEIIAEGPCELDQEGSRASMWPTLEKGLFERERGLMTLELEGGREFCISERRLRLRLRQAQGPRAVIYRMQVVSSPVDQAGPPPGEASGGVPDHLRRVDLPAGLEAGRASQAEPSGGLSTAP